MMYWSYAELKFMTGLSFVFAMCAIYMAYRCYNKMVYWQERAAIWRDMMKTVAEEQYPKWVMDFDKNEVRKAIPSEVFETWEGQDDVG